MTFDSFFAEREPAPAAQRRSDGTWECVRRDYLAGDAAPRLAERYGVSLSAIRTRARDGGWRRADLPDPAPSAADEDDEAELEEAAAASPAELRPLAWARAARAVRRGRLAEALGWTRLVRQLDVLAAREAAAPALEARAADSLARAADTLASLRHGLAPSDSHDAGADASARPTAEITTHDLHEVHEVYELHDLHAPSPLLPAQAGPREPHAPAGPDPADVAPADPGAGLRRDQREESRAPEPQAAPPAPPRPPPHRPTGPVLPHQPPPWVRSALGMR